MAGLGVIAFATMAVLLLIAPTSLAAVVPNVTTKPPFTKAVVVLSNPQSMTGCGAATLVSAASFNKTTGIGKFSDNASTTWCTTSRNNSAQGLGQIQLTIPVTIKTTGTHSISIVWATFAIGSVNLTAGTCRGSATVATSSCTRSATSFVNGFAFLIDKTAGTSTANTITWPGNATSVSNVTTCAFTVCTSVATAAKTSALHTGKALWTWGWSGLSLNATHKYSLSMTLFGGSQVVLQITSGATLRSASANAQFNSASIGQQEDLLSITVT